MSEGSTMLRISRQLLVIDFNRSYLVISIINSCSQLAMLIPIFVSSPSSPRTPSLDDRELKTFVSKMLVEKFATNESRMRDCWHSTSSASQNIFLAWTRHAKQRSPKNNCLEHSTSPSCVALSARIQSDTNVLVGLSAETTLLAEGPEQVMREIIEGSVREWILICNQFRSHKKMLPAEICGCCVSFFERATLDDKGVPYKRFIHPRIWESGDPNYPACNADLVGRAAWLFYPLVMMPQEEVSENLKSVMDEMNVYEQILVDTKRGRLIVNNKLNVLLGASV